LNPGEANSGPSRGRWGDLSPEALMAQGLQQEPGTLPPLELEGYVIEEPIGRGGMGMVYLARQLELDRRVAIKRVTAGAAHDPLMLERFAREARTMAKLEHPHVVRIYHFERTPEGGAVIVMEYLPGGNMRERLKGCPGGLPLVDSERWMRQMVAAVTAAHEVGVLHRDLKPENLLFSADDTLRIADFGLALPLAEETTRYTLTGQVVGSVDYLAPESLSDGRYDTRSDLYALGAIGYEMLTGRSARGVLEPPHRQRRGVPRAWSEAVMKALQPEPDARFASVAAFGQAWEAAGRIRSRRWFLPAVGAAGLTAGGILWMTWPRVSPEIPVTIASPTPSVGWRDLLPAVDLARDVVLGGWQRDGSALLSDAGICILRFSRRMPEAYDLRCRFIREEGSRSVAFFISERGGVGSIDLDGWDIGVSGLQAIDGRDLRGGGGFTLRLENGRPYECLIEKRAGSVRIQVDGEWRGEFSFHDSELSIVEPWGWWPEQPRGLLAIASYQSPTRFEEVLWREPV